MQRGNIVLTYSKYGGVIMCGGSSISKWRHDSSHIVAYFINKRMYLVRKQHRRIIMALIYHIIIAWRGMSASNLYSKRRVASAISRGSAWRRKTAAGV